jgi:hypothetical protein
MTEQEKEVEAERDEAVAEVKRLREALSQVECSSVYCGAERPCNNCVIKDTALGGAQ